MGRLYLTSTTINGVTYWYFRRGGRKVALGKEGPGHPDFERRYAELLAGVPPKPRRAQEGSIAAVAEAVKRGTGWPALSDGYRAAMARHLDTICEAYGSAKIADLRGRHLRADVSKLEPHAAKARLKAWRMLTRLATDRGWLVEDPAALVRPPKAPRSAGHAAWPIEAIDRYRARWPVGTPPRLAMEFLYWTAARTVDAVTLSPAMIDAGGVLVFRQSKTGGLAYVPWSAPLPAWAEGFEADRAEMRACLQPGVFTFLETGGRVRSVKGLSNLVARGARGAGLDRLTAHGLRKARLTRIAEAGGSAHAIMAWGGHATLKEAQAYATSAQIRGLVIGQAPATRKVKR
jgi:integrase